MILKFKKKNNNNNLMVFKWVLFNDFHSMLLQDLKRFYSGQLIELNQRQNSVNLIQFRKNFDWITIARIWNLVPIIILLRRSS